MKRRFRAILFDLYDTLIWLDVEESDRWRRRFAHRLGAPLDHFMQVWRRSVNERMLGRGGDLRHHLAAAAAQLGIEPEDTLIADLVALERRRLESSVKLYPSTLPVLTQLAAEGYPLGLLSNASDGAALPITHLGLDRLFDQLVLSHEVGLLKPDPAIYRLACERLQVSPQEAVFVADGGFAELDTAHDLGIFAVLIEQDHQSKDYGSSTIYDSKIRDLTELQPLLDSH